MPQTVPTSATPPPSPAAAAPSSPLPMPSILFLVESRKKSSRGALSNSTNLWPGEKAERARGEAEEEGGRGPRVGRSSNTKVMAAVVPSARPSLGSLKRRRRRRKGDPKRGKKHNALPPSLPPSADGKDLTDHARDRPPRHRPRLAYSEGALKFPDGTEPPYHSR